MFEMNHLLVKKFQKTLCLNFTTLIGELMIFKWLSDSIKWIVKNKLVQTILFGKGCGQEMETASTDRKIAERIEEISKREMPFEECEKMKQDAKRKQWEGRRLSLRVRNKTLQTQFGGYEETLDPEETRGFRRTINNKDAREMLREDRTISEGLNNVKRKVQRRRRCRWTTFISLVSM